MPTVVEALVTTLTLDASEYIANTARQRAAMKAMSSDERQFVRDMDQFNKDKERQKRDEQRQTDSQEKERKKLFAAHEKDISDQTKHTEESGKRQSEAFGKVTRSAVAMLAIFTAGKGIKDFVGSLTSGDAATSRLSRNIGMNIETMSKWQGVAQELGGTAQGVSKTFESWSDDFQNFLNGSGQSAFLEAFNKIHVSVTDTNHKLRDMGDIAMDIAKSPDFQALTRPAQATFLKNLNLDEGMSNAIMEGPDALGKRLNKQPVISAQDGKNAELFETNLNKLEKQSKSLGRSLFNDLAPGLLQVMDIFEGMMKSQNAQDFVRDVGEGLKEMAIDLRDAPWKDIKEDMHEFFHTTNEIVDALGGWKNITEVLFALWAANKVAGLVTNISKVAGALAGVKGGAGGGSVLGLLGWLGAGYEGGKLLGSAAEDAGHSLNENNETGKGIDNWWQTHVQNPARSMAGLKPLNDNEWSGVAAAPKPLTGLVANPDIERYRPLFNLIGKSEGTDSRDGYNETLGFGKWTGGKGSHTDLSHMTLDQIDALQTSMLNKQHAEGIDNASSALGRYQFTQTTLRDMRQKYGLSGDTMFDATGQDKLALQRIKMAGSDDPTALAHIWASLPVSRGDRGGAYGQGTHVSFDQVEEALSQVHSSTSRFAGNNSGDVNIARIDIHTAATDAPGIAKDMRAALNKYAFVRQANTGVVS